MGFFVEQKKVRGTAPSPRLSMLMRVQNGTNKGGYEVKL